MLVRVMGEGRVSRSEVHGVEAAGREVRDVRPRLLGTDLEIPSPLQCTDCGRVHHGRRGCVADDLERRTVGNEPREVRLGLGRLAIRRIAQIERCDGLAGDHVVRDPGV